MKSFLKKPANLKILLLVVGFLFLITGVFLVDSKSKSESENSDVGLVQSLEKVATESTEKKPEAKKNKEISSSGDTLLSEGEVYGTTNSKDKSVSNDSSKLSETNRLLGLMGEKVGFYNESFQDYSDLQRRISDIPEICESIHPDSDYDWLQDEVETRRYWCVRDKTQPLQVESDIILDVMELDTSHYKDYKSQVLKIVSDCSSCKEVWDSWVVSQKSQGLVLPQ